MIDVSKYTKVAEYKDGNLHWLEDRDINAVYLIMIGNDSYIGSSKYLYMRIQEHASQLRRSNHTDKMQEAFNKIGKFDVYTIARGIDPQNLRLSEIGYIDELKPTLNINSLDFKKSNMYRIKEILDQKGMTAKQLADRMNVTPQYISGIIREHGSASVSVLSNIAKILEVPLSSLFDDFISSDDSFVCPYCGNKLYIKKKN